MYAVQVGPAGLVMYAVQVGPADLVMYAVYKWGRLASSLVNFLIFRIF